jgi:hypothetical protein
LVRNAFGDKNQKKNQNKKNNKRKRRRRKKEIKLFSSHIPQTTWNTSKREHLLDEIIKKQLGEKSNVKDIWKYRLQ